MNRVLVRDGEVVRQGSETSHEDSFEWLQQRGMPARRARAQQVFGEDRVKFPMKRKSWQPGGGANAHGELRGRDQWEPDQLGRGHRLHCPRGRAHLRRVRPCGRHRTKALAVGKILHQLGGHISLSDTSSIGTYAFNIVALGLPSQDLGELNDRFDNKNADTIVIMAATPPGPRAAPP